MTLEQQAEPTAFYSPTKGFYWAKPTTVVAPTVVDVPPMALYTASPQRPWQGLTDEEMSDIVADIDADFGDSLWKVVCLTKIIQATLKERNI